jgi:hypothetical protein
MITFCYYRSDCLAFSRPPFQFSDLPILYPKYHLYSSIELAKKIISPVFDLGFEPALENYSPKHDADWHSEAHFRLGHFGRLLKILHHPIHPMM